mgnify:CR=1 FL=1
MDEAAVERVLRIVELIPVGEVAAYGEVGAIAGVGPRQVGAIMSRYGSAVAWWRVTNSYGDPPKHLREKAFVHWAREGIAIKPNGLGCRIADFGTDQRVLARRYREVAVRRDVRSPGA